MPREDLAWALAEIGLSERRADYGLHRDYYEGRHNMVFADERFLTVFGERFYAIRDNLCPAVVDAVVDRLKVTGFASSAATSTEVTANGRTRLSIADSPAAACWSIWKRNRMVVRSKEVHRESLITGDGYAIVWADPRGRAAIWPQVADEMAVLYSESTPGEIELAGRVWIQDDGRRRANLYYPDRTERYISTPGDKLPRSWLARSARAIVGAASAVFGEDDFQPLAVDPIVANQYGQVPVFHFPNKRLWRSGVSELVDVVPLQDALNKAVCDMLVAGEFSAYRQRWATGIEVEEDPDTGRVKAPPFEQGPDRIFAAESADTRFGDFAETDLQQFLAQQENLRSEIARVSGTPLHYLFIAATAGGSFPSGEALKSAEVRFTAKLEDRQQAGGDTWEAALKLALRIEKADIPVDDLDLTMLWADASPRDEAEQMATLVVKKTLGVSGTQLLKEAGYDDDTIDRMAVEAAAEAVVSPVVPPAAA